MNTRFGKYSGVHIILIYSQVPATICLVECKPLQSPILARVFSDTHSADGTRCQSDLNLSCYTSTTATQNSSPVVHGHYTKKLFSQVVVGIAVWQCTDRYNICGLEYIRFKYMTRRREQLRHDYRKTKRDRKDERSLSLHSCP